MMKYALQFPKQFVRKTVKQTTNDKNHRAIYFLQKVLTLKSENKFRLYFEKEFTHFTVKNSVRKSEIDSNSPVESPNYRRPDFVDSHRRSALLTRPVSGGQEKAFLRFHSFSFPNR